MAAPDMVTVLVPLVKVEPAPDVSQLPVTVHVPAVRVIVPDVPPVIETLATLTADAFAVRVPPLPTAKEPPIRPRFDVARVAAAMVSVPPHFRAFVAIVNVGLPEGGWNVTFAPNSWERLPKVIVRDVVELNVRLAEKDQETEVDAFDHAPETVQVPAPEEMYPAAVVTLTFPVTDTVDVPAARKPEPLTVKVPWSVNG